MKLKQRLRWLAFALPLALLSLAAALLPAWIGATGQAQALTPTEWQAVAAALDNFVLSQYQDDPTSDANESGYLITAVALKGRLDSNGDGNILSEGDDAAGVPVLVDVYNSDTKWIPGTAVRFAATAAADPANAGAVKNKVNAHQAAGISTDIVAYCLTGHTESPPVMAYGAMAQAGYFGATAPRSLGLKWGRAGWSNASVSYGNTMATTTAAATSPGYPLAGNSACAGVTPAGELVRCIAAGALAKVGGGTTPWMPSATDPDPDGKYQPVDLGDDTEPTVAKHDGGAYALRIPFGQLFAAGGGYGNLGQLDSTGNRTVYFTNNTQHTAAMAAQGATMLGYKSTYAKWGLPGWNNTLPEKYTGGAGYAMTSAAIDNSAPTIASVGAARAAGSATITWTTNEPATSLVEYSTTAGGPYTKVNDTVLHAGHSVSFSFDDGADLYYKVSSYDGLANGTSSGEFGPDKAAPVVTNVRPAGTVGSSATIISANYSDDDSGIDTATVSVTLDGALLSGCAVTATGVSCPASGYAEGAHSIGGSVSDNAGNSTAISGAFTYVPSNGSAPEVTYTGPNGDQYRSDLVITAAFIDPDDDADGTSAAVSLNGGAATSCLAAESQINCDVSGLADGSYQAVVSISDFNGNTGSASGSFTVQRGSVLFPYTHLTSLERILAQLRGVPVAGDPLAGLLWP